MRLLGGVWKNSEDEILKVAVMKYGKNQWARIASLMSRKSAAQCKARWYEWLDPLIKKTDWTREEDEKLLHLAKLMPMQWKTVAPMVGRTATQCLARYETLIDLAQGGNADAAMAKARQLRPGEIDPNPESKPARPDAIDMDQDELEMLSEARARLANTRGKKAKRKMREKKLQESKRLVKLQKMRELKAAGVTTANAVSRRRKRNDKELDHYNEIAWEKKAPAGFYSVDDETREGIDRVRSKEFRSQMMREINGPSKQELERRSREQDRKRQKRAEEANMEMAAARSNQRNAPPAVFKRTSLNLPPPSVIDDDLKAIAKARQADASLSRAIAKEAGRGAESSRMVSSDIGASASSSMQSGRLKLAFKNIPEPLYTYDIVVPAKAGSIEEPDDAMEEDAGDVDARLRKIEKEAREAELRKRSEVLKRGLPRPTHVSRKQTFTPTNSKRLLLRAAEELVQEELKEMLLHDQVKYPIEAPTSQKGAEKQLKALAKLEPSVEYTDDQIAQAKRLIESQVSADGIDFEEYFAAYALARKATEDRVAVIAPLSGKSKRAKVVDTSSLSREDKIELQKRAFQVTRAKMGRDAKRALDVERKARILTDGLAKRGSSLSAKIVSLHSEIVSLMTQRECFTILKQKEAVEIERRTRKAEEQLATENERTALLEKRLADLNAEKKRLEASSA